MKKGLNIWDIIAWIVLAGILIWLILKTFGVINTPAWLEYAPLYGAVYLAGWQIHKLESVSSDVRELKKFKDATINEINKSNLDFAVDRANREKNIYKSNAHLLKGIIQGHPFLDGNKSTASEIVLRRFAKQKIHRRCLQSYEVLR